MKITTISVQNFKRVKDVRITPDADRAIILIGGNNANGKSSTLDALTTAFGGKKTQPLDPVRHGATEAEIVVELDDGLTIRRVIAPNGDSHLEVRDRMGARKAPQQMLDGIVGTRFLDPLAYLALPAKEQRAQLMRLIPEADRIAGLNEKREGAFSKRTEVGRDKAKAEGELARLEERQVAKPIDVAELTAEAKRLDEQRRDHEQLVRDLHESRRVTERERNHLASVRTEIEQLEARLASLKNTAAAAVGVIEKCERFEAELRAKVEASDETQDVQGARREAVDADLKRADEHNRRVFADESHNKRRAETAENVTALTAEHESITKVIELIDQRKAEILGKAKLPVEGLGIDDDGITLNGVSFTQASRAEQLRVALGLAIAASPKLADIWVRDGAVLDDESLALLEQQAAASGHRLWIERVGTRDPGVIVIKDGQVAS